MKFKLKIKKLKLEKHLIIIFGIILVTLIISLYLFSLIFSTETKNADASVAARRLQSQLNSINKKKPTPNSNNISLITEDAVYMQEQLFELKTKLGNPYTTPLVNFIKTLTKNKKNELNSENLPLVAETKSNVAVENKKIKSESDDTKDINESVNESNYLILNKFLTSWQNYYKKNEPDLQDIDSAKIAFKEYIKSQGYSLEEYNAAFQAFRDTLHKETFEKIDNILTEDYLLNSIGFPLRITRIQCKELILKVQKRLNEKLYKNKIMSFSQTFILFDEFTAMPNDDQIPHIINYLWFYQDLIMKIIDSGIDSFPLRNKLNGLRGQVKDDMTVLKYEIEVIGTLESVRKLINEFQTSYKNNRLYSIDFVSFTKAIDDAENLPIPEKRKRKLNIEIVLGTSDLIKANIKLSYFIYSKPLIVL